MFEDHEHVSKGTVPCFCMSCGVSFTRFGAQIVVSMKNSKEIPYITEKKLIEACRKKNLAMLQPKSETDWSLMQVNLCDQCLYGFRKPVDDALLAHRATPRQEFSAGA